MILDTENIQIKWEERKLTNGRTYAHITQYFPNFGFGTISYDGDNYVSWEGTKQGASRTYLFNTGKCEDIPLEEKKKLIEQHLQKLIEANFGG
jgi:hypothetical protein